MRKPIKRRKTAPTSKPLPKVQTPAELRQVKRIEHYSAHRDLVGEAILRAALRGLAAIDAVSTVNRLLEEKFNLTDVRVDAREAAQGIENVLRAEVVYILTRASILPEEMRREFSRRFVAKLLPTKDDVQVGAPLKVGDQIRFNDLERLIQKDLQSYARKGEGVSGK